MMYQQVLNTHVREILLSQKYVSVHDHMNGMQIKRLIYSNITVTCKESFTHDYFDYYLIYGIGPQRINHNNMLVINKVLTQHSSKQDAFHPVA